MAKKQHLGRGLEALISVLPKDIGILSTASSTVSVETQEVKLLPISMLTPPKWQPRKNFSQEKLEQLAESIKSSGVIEPLIVSPLDDTHYEIVCGERRYRAAKIAGIDKLPVIIKPLSEQQKMLISLIENIQREDLNPVEEAYAYKKIIEEYNITQEELAKIVGKTRSVITNTLRILSLPEDVLKQIEDGTISAGHARSLASITDTRLVYEIAEKIVQDKLTVRDVEEIVRHLKSARKRVSGIKQQLPEIRQLESDLGRLLGTKVRIVNTKNAKGKIVIYYYSLADFDKIIKKLKG